MSLPGHVPGQSLANAWPKPSPCLAINFSLHKKSLPGDREANYCK